MQKWASRGRRLRKEGVLLLCSRGFGSGVGVLLGEALDAAGGVNQLLFAREEGMAVRADFHAQRVALDGRACCEIVAAGAVHGDGVIVGVDTGFHDAPFCRVRSARHLDKDLIGSDRGRGITAASLGREPILNHTRSVKFRKMATRAIHRPRSTVLQETA